MTFMEMSETCKRFQQTTQRVFPKEFDILCWGKYRKGELQYSFRSKNHFLCDYISLDVERFVRSFGRRFSTLEIDRDPDPAVVNLVTKYCEDVTLKRLKISSLKSIEGVRVQLNAIFQRLPKLTVRDCDLLVIPADTNCDSLIELNIDGSSGCVAMLKHTFPNLECFVWDWSETIPRRGDNESKIFWNFIGRHSRLKTIDLRVHHVFNYEVLHVILKSCQELEKLTLRRLISSKIPFDISRLTSPAKLRMLDLNFIGEFPSEYIAFLREIPWAMLGQLRDVDLHGTDLYGTNVVKIIRKLTKLQAFGRGFDIGRNELKEIVQIVERREHVLTLEGQLKFTVEDESPKLRLVNCYQRYLR